jgi:hypothetical protein
MAKRADSGEGSADAAALYGLPLDRFTAERDALAKRLRADGDREAAAGVRKLRKPSVPAWAINQAVRADAAAARELLEAGEGLARAQEATLSGSPSAQLREAVAAHGEAVERMMGPVAEALGPAAGAANLDRARETLRAVAGDDELRAEIEAASVVRDREAVGFGGAAPATLKPAPPRRRGSQGSRRRAEDGVRKAQRALEAAAAEVEESERRLERAQRQLEAASEAREGALGELQAREAELEQARAEVERLDRD